MSAQVAADLRAAAEVLRRDGWTQHKFYARSTGGRCLVGAINNVTRSQKRRAAACETARRHVGAPFSVTFWNDRRGRTADDVIAALEAAADAAEATS